MNACPIPSPDDISTEFSTAAKVEVEKWRDGQREVATFICTWMPSAPCTISQS
ncbi:hypothetical protein [Herbaspirillum sp. 3C11]|uniref:hypothetical protein n=1 Tax=Herbaspirillum sp. 3C11 TaxID=2559615 RepID=UPI001FD77185|nr:hypothetical protein [Herbaspirillum sp. 3C11]